MHKKYYYLTKKSINEKTKKCLLYLKYHNYNINNQKYFIEKEELEKNKN